MRRLWGLSLLAVSTLVAAPLVYATSTAANEVQTNSTSAESHTSTIATIPKQAMDAQANPDTLFQVSSFIDLFIGNYDGDYSIGNLEKQGDFGLGTYNHLDGELVALDGRYYQITGDGKAHLVPPAAKTPFAVVVHFKSQRNFAIKKIANYKSLDVTLNSKLHNFNIPYAVRISGIFKSIKLRSFYPQKPPYAGLKQAIKTQHEYTLHNVKGTLVGFRFPNYMSTLSLPGYHFHFITANRKTGGHVLNVDIQQAKVSVDPIHRFTMYLPRTLAFAKATLNKANNHEKEIQKVERSTD